jgi:hypothetical protein
MSKSQIATNVNAKAKLKVLQTQARAIVAGVAWGSKNSYNRSLSTRQDVLARPSILASIRALQQNFGIGRIVSGTRCRSVWTYYSVSVKHLQTITVAPIIDSLLLSTSGTRSTHLISLLAMQCDAICVVGRVLYFHARIAWVLLMLQYYIMLRRSRPTLVLRRTSQSMGYTP